jgi:hypothetical protein
MCGRIAYGAPMEITPGSEVQVRNALDETLRLIAVTDVVRGIDFPVVWVCEPDEWAAAQAEEREPQAIPWPAEDVSLGVGHP